MNEWTVSLEVEPWLLVACFSALIAVGAVVVSVCSVWIAQRAIRRNAELQVALDVLRGELNYRVRVMENCSIGLGQSLSSLDARLKKAVEEKLEAPGDFSQLAHKQLSKLVALGASSEDLVHNCGLSKAEADLLLLLKSARKSETESQTAQV